MTLISILAFVLVAAVAALTKQRSLDPVAAGATIAKVRNIATVAVEGFSFLRKLMDTQDPKPAVRRFGQVASSVTPADDEE